MQTVSVPYVGQNSREGVIREWTKGEGESIAREEVLVRLETDDVTFELQGYVGVVRKVHLYPGQLVESGMVIGLVGRVDEPLPDESIFSHMLPASPPQPDFVAWPWVPVVLKRPLEAVVNVSLGAVMVVYILMLMIFLFDLGRALSAHQVNGPTLFLESGIVIFLALLLVSTARRRRQARKTRSRTP